MYRKVRKGGFSPHTKSKSVTTTEIPDLPIEVSNFISDLSPINTKLILASQGKVITEEELKDIRNELKKIQEKYKSHVPSETIKHFVVHTNNLYRLVKRSREESSMPFGEPSPTKRRRHGGRGSSKNKRKTIKRKNNMG